MADTTSSNPSPAVRCQGCRDGEAFAPSISMAFQPIMDIEQGVPFAFEALVRGSGGEGAASVLSQVTEENRYAFDQRCRVRAIETAVRAGILETPARLSINFLPNAVYSPAACIQLTLQTARSSCLPTDRLIFEFTEDEKMVDTDHVSKIVAAYREMGFGTAIDDFGAGHAGLNLLARFQPDIIKLDMGLVRGLDANFPKRTIIAAIVKMCDALEITTIAEGVETRAEAEALREIGVRYLQGYYFAKPGFEMLPQVALDLEPGNRAA